MIKGSLVAIVTPMTADGAVDYDAFESLIEAHVAAGTSGLVVAGTTGESATLTKSEHVAVIAAAVSHHRAEAFSACRYIIDEVNVGPVAKHLYNELTAIQYGRKEDPYGWTMKIDVA